MLLHGEHFFFNSSLSSFIGSLLKPFRVTVDLWPPDGTRQVSLAAQELKVNKSGTATVSWIQAAPALISLLSFKHIVVNFCLV